MKSFNKQNTLLAVVIAALIIFTSIFFIKSISVEALESSIKIKGLYGIEIPYKDIVEIRGLDSLPFLGLKTNGINLGFMNIGMFTYKELGNVRLFEIRKEKPYIVIIGKDEKIVLGLGKEKNEEIFKILEEKINNVKK